MIHSVLALPVREADEAEQGRKFSACSMIMIVALGNINADFDNGRRNEHANGTVGERIENRVSF